MLTRALVTNNYCCRLFHTIRFSSSNTSSAKSLSSKKYNYNKVSYDLPKPNRKKMLKISVDGNISSGKSTLVSKLAEFFLKATTESGERLFSLEVVPEPLEKWCNLNGHNLLDMFYKDSAKNNFLFQHYVQLTRLMDTVKGSPPVDADGSDSSSKTKVRVMERSLQNNRYCFLELAKRNERIHPAEFTVLAEWYNFLERNLDLSLDLIIYLRTKPETAFSRMKARARTEEDSCPFEYLRDLHESYEDWLIKKTAGGDDSIVKQEVLVVDAEQSKEQVARQCFGLLEDYLKLAKPEIFRSRVIPS